VAVAERGPRWEIQAWGLDPPDARRAVRSLFSLDHDLPQFYRLTRRDPTLSGTERQFRGLRLPRDSTVYEALLHAIIGQQLSVRAALSIQQRLYERAGSMMTVEGVEVPAVPSPSALERIGEEGLRSVGLSAAKSRALLELARGGPNRAANDRALATGPLDEAIGRLVALRGVGRWTAENALLRGAGRTDVFVAGDLGIRVALAARGVVPRDAPEERARAWADARYPGWGSYATLYLWRQLVTERRAAAG
jgi:DNA-3-methyladenine glycosylase II